MLKVRSPWCYFLSDSAKNVSWVRIELFFIGGILPVAPASSTCGASHCPTVPSSGSTRLARNSLPNVVMPDPTASSLARMISSRARQRWRQVCSHADCYAAAVRLVFRGVRA